MSELIRQSVERMDGYTPGEQPRGAKLVKLNTNENPYPPSPAVTEALRTFNSDDLRLYPDPVSLSLRRRIAEMHGRRPDEVMVANGSDEVLALCTRAFVENDGSIGYFNPSYSLYPVLAAIRGVEARPVSLTAEFEWNMPKKYAASLFFLANPNAPTGMLFEFDRVREFCSEFTGVVVIDEAYVDFAERDCMSLAIELPNVIVMRTVSKSYSLAGLRLGYAVGAGPLVDALLKIKDSYNVDALTQYVGLAALSDLCHMRANAGRIKATRARLAGALGELGFSVCAPQANFVWARPETIGAEELFRQLRSRKILVRYFPGERTENHVRITVGTDEEIDLLLTAIGDMVGDH